jgi:hypothetical protein
MGREEPKKDVPSVVSKLFRLPDYPVFFIEQAEGPPIQFIYDVPAGHVSFVNTTYPRVLGVQAARDGP